MSNNPFIVTFILLFSFSSQSLALTVPMPANPNDEVISVSPDGNSHTLAENGETLLDVARRFDLGQTEIVRLNPDVDRWLPKNGELVRVANLRILPDAPRHGIVLNVAEARMYYYQTIGANQPRFVRTYPIGYGREEWNTPLGATKVINKMKNPVWRPPASIRAEHAAQGDPLPAEVPAGPDNPLGAFALYLGFSGYRIHGTDKPYSIGLRATHGCTRLYPEDIEELFPLVAVGTPVNIVNQPAKAGWLDDTLYVEIHPGLEHEELPNEQLLQLALAAIQKANNNQMPTIDGAALKQALENTNGIPVAVYHRENFGNQALTGAAAEMLSAE
ncbi:MAG: L,D-transpeptidase family protein [Gammaproteobacteria bacterium]